MSTLASSSRPTGLDPTLKGKVVLPEDAGFDAARRAWNLAVDQRPSMVVFPETPADVAAAVRLTRELQWQIAPQATGHNAEPLGSLENTILLKTERMRAVTIDPATRSARIEAGVLAGQLAEAAARYGLAAVAGTSADVGFVGYTLGGGIGILSRRFGPASRQVRAVELVTADGELVRADHEQLPDLFWALRGGGGSFGVVTAVVTELLPVTEAYAGSLWYPIERADEVLHTWRELVQAGPPDELSTIARMMSFPPLPELPEAVRGKSFALIHVYHVGNPTHADRLLEPLRALSPINDTVQITAMPSLSGVAMDPPQPVPVAGDGLMLRDFPAEALDALLSVAGPHAGPQLAIVELRHLEGQLARGRPDSGAVTSIPAKYALYAGGLAPTPDIQADSKSQIKAIQQALAPWATRYLHPNFAETKHAPESLWTEQAYERLRRTKATVDPDDVIRSNHPIQPRHGQAVADLETR
jgi:FAD/FMN-containing dehydrogenase